MSSQEDIAIGLEAIFSGIRHLNDAFPKREFTIDGRLVGDIGEVIASMIYDIELDTVSQPKYDGTTASGKRVQVKATFQDALTFKTVPELYLGLKINKDGSFEEIYNGPGQPIYDYYSQRKGIGEELLRFPNDRLKKLSAQVSLNERVPRRR